MESPRKTVSETHLEMRADLELLAKIVLEPHANASAKRLNGCSCLGDSLWKFSFQMRLWFCYVSFVSASPS
jgi:hypothetical protein